MEETRYSDNDLEIDYRLKHRFYKKYANFLLHRDPAAIPEWLKPFIDAFTISKEMADFLSDVISEEIILGKYDSFWAIWECFYPVIKAAAQTDHHRHFNEIIRNYMLAWPWWQETAKEWRSLRERESAFFQRICTEMGQHPSVLYSISKFLNEIGSGFIDKGIIWISEMLSKNESTLKEDVHPNTIYYLEIIVRKFAYLNRTKLKTTPLVREQVLIILNFLVSKGSVNAYLLREEII